jgi:PadR family transcriptional regulator, regulatory protein PadR
MEIQQGALALTVPKTLHVLAPLYGYGIARPIGPISSLLLDLPTDSAVASEWRPSNNPHARFYRPTRAGRKQPLAELQGWRQRADMLARLQAIHVETRSCKC